MLSTTLFNLYIDQPLCKLWKPGFGCHINHVYIGVISDMDYITISRPVFMVNNICWILCNQFVCDNCITFNSN